MTYTYQIIQEPVTIPLFMQLFDQPIMRQLCNAEIHADTALQLQVFIISNIKMSYDFDHGMIVGGR